MASPGAIRHTNRSRCGGLDDHDSDLMAAASEKGEVSLGARGRQVAQPHKPSTRTNRSSLASKRWSNKTELPCHHSHVLRVWFLFSKSHMFGRAKPNYEHLAVV